MPFFPFPQKLIHYFVMNDTNLTGLNLPQSGNYPQELLALHTFYAHLLRQLRAKKVHIGNQVLV